MELLSSALASGRAHVASPDGGAPEAPEAWGWHRTGDGCKGRWRAQGAQIGWRDGAALYLEPEASYAVAQKGGAGILR